ncbi:Retrovirus-related Pol polyprotein from transposon TNT 1-94 OS=Nicotiana tabacum PE=2 SV=1 [Rhizoctonia solani AG-1 IB]|uniref:Retrovirus-related Pol polyprotein from transposon TNT 1-94 n=1 Tax=Thanatephorus cucumeris (strain AG1-IB / isolate 7/3/14) TaxID=1108050 RepID=A0A0B7FGS9_THACB|nr:Retrovirus-related Pol polyprotein from transposon TNT 1-94 OS=Nicotiana tabacum PE=2 SV=1 [Rhizoctonia solani AG-1 IB]
MEVIETPEGLDFECKTCIQAKAHQRPFPKDSKTEAKEIGELIVTDVWGPAQVKSIGNYRYYVSFTDVATRFTRLGFLKHKDETLEEYKAFEAMLNTQKGLKIKRVRFDNGGEFVNNNWRSHAAQKGTILETTAPYSAQQNGIAERLNRTLAERARAMLIESRAPKFLWSEAIAYACYLKNRIPTQIHGKFWPTPFEAFWGRKPEVSNLHPWGTKCYVLGQGENRSKLDPKSFLARFTGISDIQGKSWRYYKEGAHKILHSRNVFFLRKHMLQTDEKIDFELLEPTIPPAEGENKENDSSRMEEHARNTHTGGEKSDTKTNKQEDMKDIKEEKKEHKTPSHLPTKANTKPLTAPSTIRLMSPAQATRSKTTKSPASPPVSNTANTNYTGIRTRRGRTGEPHMEVLQDRGKLQIKIDDTQVKGQSDHCTSEHTLTHDSETNETTNLCIEQPLTNIYADLPALEPIYPYANPPSDLPGLTDLAYKLSELLKHRTTKSPTDSDDETLLSHGVTDNEPHWALAARASNPDDNPTYEQAMTSPESSQWIAAMEEEYSQLMRMGTFTPTPRPPTGTNIIGCRWVFAKKRDEHGNVTRYKARLVAKGYTQKPGQDFDDTFAPVLRLDSLRILCSLACYNDWDMRQLDVVGAYLNATLQEELYMEQIPGFSDSTDNVLRLHRSLLHSTNV